LRGGEAEIATAVRPQRRQFVMAGRPAGRLASRRHVPRRRSVIPRFRPERDIRRSAAVADSASGVPAVRTAGEGPLRAAHDARAPPREAAFAASEARHVLPATEVDATRRVSLLHGWGVRVALRVRAPLQVAARSGDVPSRRGSRGLPVSAATAGAMLFVSTAAGSNGCYESTSRTTWRSNPSGHAT